MLALYAIVAPVQWLIKVMGYMAVEFFVLIVANFASGTSPKRLSIVNRFPLWNYLSRLFVFWLVAGHCRWFLLKHLHGDGDMVGVLFNNTAQTPVIGKFLFFTFQVQSDCGSSLAAFNCFKLIIGFAFTAPANRC